MIRVSHSNIFAEGHRHADADAKISCHFACILSVGALQAETACRARLRNLIMRISQMTLSAVFQMVVAV